MTDDKKKNMMDLMSAHRQTPELAEHAREMDRRGFFKALLISLACSSMSPIGWSLASENSSNNPGLLELGTGKRLDELYQGLHLYYGDIHGHTGYSDGFGTPEQYYDYARYEANLDFAAVSDHAEWLNRFSKFLSLENDDPFPLWPLTINAANSKYFPDHFCTLIGFEWTSDQYGHKNVYFRNTDKVPKFPFGYRHYPTPKHLWDALEPYQALTISHHVIRPKCLTDWRFMNSNMERLVEIYSKWGNAESAWTDYEPFVAYYKYPDWRSVAQAHDVLHMHKLGHRIGIIAGTDTHQGMPGSTKNDEPRGEIFPAGAGIKTGEQFLWALEAGYTYDHREPVGANGGLAAVWAPRLTREAIWDGLYSRHTFGTSGIRPEVRFAVQDADDRDVFGIIGEEFTLTGMPQILCSIYCEPGSYVLARYHPYSDNPLNLGFLDADLESGSQAFYTLVIHIRQHADSNSDFDLIPEVDVQHQKLIYKFPQLFEKVWVSPIWISRK